MVFEPYEPPRPDRKESFHWLAGAATMTLTFIGAFFVYGLIQFSIGAPTALKSTVRLTWAITVLVLIFGYRAIWRSTRVLPQNKTQVGQRQKGKID